MWKLPGQAFAYRRRYQLVLTELENVETPGAGFRLPETDWSVAVGLRPSEFHEKVRGSSMLADGFPVGRSA